MQKLFKSNNIVWNNSKSKFTNYMKKINEKGVEGMPYYDHLTRRYLKEVKERIKDMIYKPIAPLEVTAWVTPEPVSFEERMTGEKRSLKVGETWGQLWDCAWFNFKGTVPDGINEEDLVLLIDLSGEAYIADHNGRPIQGLTTVSSEFDLSLGRPGKKVVHFLDIAKPGDKIIDIWADAGCNDLFGNYKDSGIVKEAHLALCNNEAFQLYYDFEVLYELMEQIPEDKARHMSILAALNDATNALLQYKEEGIGKARKILARELEKKCGDESLSISAIGHAHIDLAWLWPIRETIRKGARSFSTVLRNMEKYPDYVFGASQPQLYQWMKDYYPELYSEIKERVQEGRWELQGAMWVEADTNVPSGESLVRQILYGKRFFKEEFGQDMKILWLPDVFGYSAALPQILKKSGVDYFMTIKLSWSLINKFPHHTFIWKGIDGSEVLAHMPPEGTYNSSAAPRAIAKTEKEFLDKGVSDRALLLFGIGDGGGGPGQEHLERLKRQKNLNGLVPVVQEPAINFFQRIEKDKDKYKKWHGELYLERHQGTYTSQARSKRYNRKLEINLRELEFAAVFAHLISGKEYPQSQLEKIWKEVLLYQFHDILPGSSITRVYDESLERYAKLMETTENMIEDSYLSIIDKIDPGDARNYIVAVNSLSWDRQQWIKHEDKWIKVEVPALGYKVVDLDRDVEVPVMEIEQDNVLENDKLRVVFASDGSIESVYDKECHREVLDKNQRSNRLIVYEDHGDAWDFPIQYDEYPGESFELVDSTTYIDGPKVIRKSRYSYGKSTLTQEVVLTYGSKRVDFNTVVDWKEDNKMLRSLFSVNAYSHEVTCDIQFGNIKRPTHENTSWDMAKYEICAHKWVDISQGDYGVALLNDCKYGHKVWENNISINLLRSPSYPDPKADRAVHEFTYSLYPHEGNYDEGNVVREGYELNIPIRVIKGKNNAQEAELSKMGSFVRVDKDSVVVESIKKAEEDDSIIIRLYECHGRTVSAKLDFGFQVSDVELVDLMEQKIDSDKWNKETKELKFNPFEINTIKVYTP